MKKWKVYALSVILTLMVGALSGVISMDSMREYAGMNRPALAPPAWLFPVVWTILFILMAVGAARVYLKTNKISWIYVAQLVVNFVWPIIFFYLNAYLFAFFWLILLLVLVIVMTIQFYKVDKIAGLIQIPYILWLLFAGYLNFMVFLLN